MKAYYLSFIEKSLIRSSLILIFIGFFSCKTKTVLVENSRNLKDSIENVKLKSELEHKEKYLLKTDTELELLKKEIINISEEQKLSKSEKQQLNETLITIVEDYDKQGNLVKKTYSEKVSEIAKDLNRSEQKNKFLENELTKSYLLNESLSADINKIVSEKTDLLKKVKFLENENKELQLKKITKAKYPWWLLIVGVIGGVFLSISFRKWVPWRL